MIITIIFCFVYYLGLGITPHLSHVKPMLSGAIATSATCVPYHFTCVVCPFNMAKIKDSKKPPAVGSQSTLNHRAFVMKKKARDKGKIEDIEIATLNKNMHQELLCPDSALQESNVLDACVVGSQTSNTNPPNGQHILSTQLEANKDQLLQPLDTSE
ncbi:uncharacterized protein LOC131034543 isoform X2 [Cryptomeria japonica]|uniref:uncharacterized protein LOC131034543 isoform X2 n=1 Tax=Cryptomeria japonica TaxID=3369 RepID=UPI0025ABA0C1|nr:uncharacterized protein LOC131034543 isoform X2 [Cryptomeria japonica]